MLASTSKLYAQCDRIVGTSSMEPLNPCNDIVRNSCQVPAKCVSITREGYITYKDEQFQFPRKTKMYQLSCKAKTFWTALSCAFNRAYFQYLQCPCTVLFTFSPRPYSNLSSYFFCFSDFYSRTISILNQQVNRDSSTISMRIIAYPSCPIYSNGPTAPSSTTEAKSRWTTSGSVGPKMASPKISPPGTGWGGPGGYSNDLEIWLMWNAHKCAWLSHVYLDFLMLLCNWVGCPLWLQNETAWVSSNQ